MTEDLSVGFSLFHAEGPGERADLVEAAMRMLDSRLWGHPLRHLSVTVWPGRPYPRWPGTLVNKDRDRVLREMLVHGDVCELTLARSAKTLPQHASASIGTRPNINDAFVSTYGRQWIDSAHPAARDAWVSFVIAFAAELRVTHGVIAVMNDLGVLSEGCFGGFVRNDVLQHPFPKEFRRMVAVQRELGIRYVRFPRWGTIYAHAQVAALGGVERIREVVAPALIRDLGDAMYFQLTESVATAVTPESLAKQRAFTELATPLLPPPLSA